MVYRKLIDATMNVVFNRMKERTEEIRVLLGGMRENGEISEEAYQKIDKELHDLWEDL